MVSNLSVQFKNNKISKLTINDYKTFDLDKWQGRLKEINLWINKNHSELKGFSRDLTPQGAKNYLKAIELFSNRKLAKDEKIFIDKDLQLIHLKDSVFVHITWHNSKKWGRFSSNGLIVAINGKAVMVDTAMDNETTGQLYNYLKNKMNIEITQFIAGHFHDDCIGGIDFLHSKGVESLVGDLTMEQCKKHGLTLPTESFNKSKMIDFNGRKLEAHYYGGGHTADNIVVWLPGEEILFGGCLIKASSARGIGNLSDAVLEDWDGTVEKVKKAYPDVGIVIPGHGNYGGAELLSHTIKVVQDYKKTVISEQ
ncbi:subclass B1 metallo-beta-lactamase [Labilibacter sediminis]|nr:subclass B1 metallo-beta-lactamase [Labilibacter sediminis]